MSARVLCAGRLYCDVVFTGSPRLPTLGTEVFAEGLSLHAGGGAFITGATLSALGDHASQLSVLPAAPFDAPVLAQLKAQNVSSKLCAAAPKGSDPQITVAIPCGNDRAFLTRAPGAALPSVDVAELAGFSHLHIGELGTLEEVPGLLDLAREAEMTVSLDCGWQDKFSVEAATLIEKVDVFLPNQRELEALMSVGVPELCASLTVVKNGENGARAITRGQSIWLQERSKPVPMVDATGAGDAFNGGFVSQWLKGASLEACLRQGNFCGAASVQSAGGVGGLSSLSSLELAETIPQ
ncbi:MAG: carbohydrate kinase [Boseongicola sp.]|nr:carbohydrate kinase [Boseongicola sp.]